MSSSDDGSPECNSSGTESDPLWSDPSEGSSKTCSEDNSPDLAEGEEEEQEEEEESSTTSEQYRKNTCIVYSPGNPTLFLDSLNLKTLSDRDCQLLHRHLSGVKVDRSISPLWPDPGVLIQGMSCRSMAKFPRPL